MSNILNTGDLNAFFLRWNCTPNERNLIVLYLAVIRLKDQIDSLNHFMSNHLVTDGDGI